MNIKSKEDIHDVVTQCLHDNASSIKHHLTINGLERASIQMALELLDQTYPNIESIEKLMSKFHNLAE